ncbi:50S ribosomal protein L24 [Ornithinimicrobium sp. LYQ92]|uniref:50S ribosomal protein L24 n=1 Tax=Serinicoccus sp. LYQ92 TaxID=3378798 RepID=UPI0038519779
MAKMKIKKNDLVQVIAGKDKGLQGKVIAVHTETGRVLVEGVNRITKHTRAGGQRGVNTGGIQVQEAPIHISNVMVVDAETKKPTRIRTRVDSVERGDGTGRDKTVRTRVAVRSGKDI